WFGVGTCVCRGSCAELKFELSFRSRGPLTGSNLLVQLFHNHIIHVLSNKATHTRTSLSSPVSHVVRGDGVGFGGRVTCAPLRFFLWGLINISRVSLDSQAGRLISVAFFQVPGACIN
ncbi:unnamed protein product, partial [Pylaiella littoralis]